MPRFRGEDVEDESEGTGRHGDGERGRIGDGRLLTDGDYAGRHAKVVRDEEDDRRRR